MKESMGLRIHGSFVAGTGGFAIGWNAQCFDRWSLGWSGTCPTGHLAPVSIQARRVSTSAGFRRGPAGGITTSLSRPATYLISRLWALEPGTIAGTPEDRKSTRL